MRVMVWELADWSFCFAALGRWDVIAAIGAGFQSTSVTIDLHVNTYLYITLSHLNPFNPVGCIILHHIG